MTDRRKRTAPRTPRVAPPLGNAARVACTLHSVEGGERSVLHSIDWAAVSIGILVVEMRFNDARNNRAIFDMLRSAGFELVRSLGVWGDTTISSRRPCNEGDRVFLYRFFYRVFQKSGFCFNRVLKKSQKKK